MLLKRDSIVEMIVGEIFIRSRNEYALKEKKHHYDKSTKLRNKNVF